MWIKQNWKFLLLPRYSFVTNDGQVPWLVWIFQLFWFVTYLHTITCTDQFPTKDICDTFNGVKPLCPRGLLQKSTTLPLLSKAICCRLVKVIPQSFPWTDTTNLRLLISHWFLLPSTTSRECYDEGWSIACLAYICLPWNVQVQILLQWCLQNKIIIVFWKDKHN